MSDTAADRPAPGTPPDDSRLTPQFRELCQVVAKLRSPEGCPWDREQTLESIKPYTLEETYELLEAIDSGNDAEICEELGDVLLQVLLDSQIAADEGRFDLTDVVAGLTRKLIARHPHVFGNAEAATPRDVNRQWDRIKQAEKQRESVFDGLPTALPALAGQPVSPKKPDGWATTSHAGKCCSPSSRRKSTNWRPNSSTTA